MVDGAHVLTVRDMKCVGKHVWAISLNSPQITVWDAVEYSLVDNIVHHMTGLQYECSDFFYICIFPQW